MKLPRFITSWRGLPVTEEDATVVIGIATKDNPLWTRDATEVAIILDSQAHQGLITLKEASLAMFEPEKALKLAEGWEVYSQYMPWAGMELSFGRKKE